MNTFKTVLLMGLLTGLFIAIGGYIGGNRGMIYALILAGGMNFFSYWFSDKIVLKMYGAKEIDPVKDSALYSLVDNLRQSANIPMPKIYKMPMREPNAFATGRNPHHAAVAVTEGILELLTRDELEGVIAHELAHVKNRDILISTLAATMAGAISILARMAYFFGGSSDSDNRNPFAAFFVLIFSGLAAMLIQMAVSRSREYLADETGGRICGRPLSLANALKKLEMGVKNSPMDPDTNSATAHMFIVNPFSAEKVVSLFSTHPPIKDRVKKLEELYDKLN